MSSSRLRVLHVLEATLGGTRRYLEDIVAANAPFEMGLAYALERADTSFPATLESARANGWETWHVPMVRRLDPLSDTRAGSHLRKIVRAFRPALVHAHSSKAGGIARLVGMTLASRPRIVYSPHAIASELGTAYAAIERLLAPLTARFAAVSESERRQLAALDLVGSARIDVIPPTIDENYWSARPRDAARAALGLPARVPIIIGIGRLSPQKNPLEFVRIIERLRAEWPELRAIWIGDGELRSELEAASIASAAAHVEIAGWVGDVRTHLAAADALLSVSRYESFGYVVAEALAMNRTVVASRVTGIEDILGTEPTLMYQPGDIGAAAALLHRVLSDENFASERRQGARADVLARFNAQTMRRALERVYASALA